MACRSGAEACAGRRVLGELTAAVIMVLRWAYGCCPAYIVKRARSALETVPRIFGTEAGKCPGAARGWPPAVIRVVFDHNRASDPSTTETGVVCDHRGANDPSDRGCSMRVRMRRHAATTSVSASAAKTMLPDQRTGSPGVHQRGEYEPQPCVRPERRCNQRELVRWSPRPLPSEPGQQQRGQRQPDDPEHKAGPALGPYLVDAQGDECAQPQGQWPRYPTVSHRRGDGPNSERQGDQDERDCGCTGQLTRRCQESFRPVHEPPNQQAADEVADRSQRQPDPAEPRSRRAVREQQLDERNRYRDAPNAVSDYECPGVPGADP
jgi:hypothetical protein